MKAMEIMKEMKVLKLIRVNKVMKVIDLMKVMEAKGSGPERNAEDVVALGGVEERGR